MARVLQTPNIMVAFWSKIRPVAPHWFVASKRWVRGLKRIVSTGSRGLFDCSVAGHPMSLVAFPLEDSRIEDLIGTYDPKSTTQKWPKRRFRTHANHGQVAGDVQEAVEECVAVKRLMTSSNAAYYPGSHNMCQCFQESWIRQVGFVGKQA